jgi:O-antigen/teichoic acid export membrane protein
LTQTLIREEAVDEAASVVSAPVRSSVVRNAVALMFSTIATSVLGMVFWTVAARFAPPDALGKASALTAAVTLLAGLAQLNLASVMPRFLPVAGRATGKFITRGYLGAALVGLVLSVGYALSGLGRDFLPRTPVQIALFAASVMLLAILIVQDGVLAALRKATWVPVVKAGFAAAKVGLLPLFVAWGLSDGLFLAWSAPVVVAVGAVTVLLFARVVPRHVRATADRAALPGRRDLASFLSGQYAGSIVFNVVYGVPPVLVATVLGDQASAFFAIPWLIATSVTGLLANIGMSLVAEVSGDEGQLRTHLRRAARLSVLVAGGGGAVLVAAAPLALLAFGPAYATQGTMTLRLLGFGLPFAGIVFLYTALNAIDRRVWRSVLAQAAVAVVFLGGGLLTMGRYGTAGMAVAFDVAEALVAVVVLPRVVRALRGPRVEPAPRPSVDPTAWWLACVALALGVLTPVVVLLPVGVLPKVVLVLLFAFLGPGGAVLGKVRLGDAVASWAMAFLLSVALFALVSVGMVWTRLWYPYVGLLLLAVPTVGLAGHTVLRGGRPSLPAWGRPRLVETAPLVAALGLWVYSLTRSHIAGAGDYGLLSAMHPTFVAAAVLVCFGFALSLRRPGWVSVAYVVAALVILRATVPLLVSAPEYAWTYKHLAVVEFIRTTGSVVDPTDIYQQWPTFFSACAVLLKLTGLSALRMGAWAPLVNDLMYLLPLFAIARTLCTDRRVPYLTVFLFTVANWVAQDYFSPQAFVYGLCLGVMLILLRWLRRVPGPGGKFTPTRLWNWLSRDLADVPYASKRAMRVALATLYLLYLVIATAHQLSPYLVAMCAAALVVLGLVSPRQLVPVLLGIAVLYLLPRQTIVEQYGIFDGFNIFKNAQGTSASDWGSAGQEFSALVVRVLSLAIWGLALLAVLRWRRRLGPVAAPATLAFAPFALLLAQSYGGEAIYRVFLFSLPWCAYLIALLVARIRWGRLVLAGGTLLLSATMLAGIQGAHGQLDVDLFSQAEIQASGYLYGHAEPGAAIVLATSDFPAPFTANYGGFKPGRNGVAELMKAGGLAHLKLNEDDLPAVEQFARDQGGDTAYLVISRSMKVYAHYFGYLADGALDTLDRSLDASPRWSLFYRNADVAVYQLTAPPF